MKLLVVSHACITPINQSFYADLERRTGWSVTLALPDRWMSEYGDTLSASRWPDFHGSIVPLGVFLSGDIPRHVYRSRFTKLLRDEAPDAIYVHHEPYGFATMQIYFANQLSIRRPIGFYAAQNILKHYPPPIRQLEQWIFQQSQFAFPVTTSALEILRAKGYQHSAEVLPLAVSTQVYRPASAWAEEQRRHLQIPKETLVLGYLGRLVEEKGLLCLLDALESIEDLPWELVVVGSGPLEEAMRRRCAEVPLLMAHVRFMGFVPHTEAPQWLSFFDILVLPSETRPNWKEQFGRVLLEGMACGTPAIGSDSGEIPHIIEATGGGVVFPEGNASALAECIRRLGGSEELRKRLATRGSETVLDSYNQEHLADIFARVIEAAVAA